MIELSEMTASEATTLVKANLGGKVQLTKDYMTNKAGSEWVIKSCNNLGGTCVIAVSPVGGGKGFFAPYLHFRLAADLPAAAPEVAEPVAATPAPINPDLPIEIRGEFQLDGFDVDAPLYEAFYRVAPDSDTAKELFLAYANEHSEFDTEFLDDLMRAAKVRPHAHWSDVNVTQMLMLLTEVQKEDPSTEDEIGTTVAEHLKRMGQPVVPPQESKPAIFIHPDVKQPLSGPEPAAPKKRGRPPGSKNKAAETAEPLIQQPAVRVVEEPVLAAALDNLPPVAHEGRHFSEYLKPDTEEVQARVTKSDAVFFAPSPVAVELAANLLMVLGAEENPEFLLSQVVGMVRRALMID